MKTKALVPSLHIEVGSQHYQQIKELHLMRALGTQGISQLELFRSSAGITPDEMQGIAVLLCFQHKIDNSNACEPL